MIKRRKDYENFLAMFKGWSTAWEVGGNIYTIDNLFHPNFIWFVKSWPGRRLWVIWHSIKRLVRYSEKAMTTEKLKEQQALIEECLAKITHEKIMRCFRKDEKALDLWGDS